MAIVKNVTQMSPLGAIIDVCVCVCVTVLSWVELEAEAATNTQRPLRSLIVCLHNKSNVSREIIYTRTVLNKWIPHLLNARAFFMLCFVICLHCSMIAWQHTCLFSKCGSNINEEAGISWFPHILCHWCIWCYFTALAEGAERKTN